MMTGTNGYLGREILKFTTKILRKRKSLKLFLCGTACSKNSLVGIYVLLACKDKQLIAFRKYRDFTSLCNAFDICFCTV